MHVLSVLLNSSWLAPNCDGVVLLCDKHRSHMCQSCRGEVLLFFHISCLDNLSVTNANKISLEIWIDSA
jgi:hypothetical protein